MTESLVPPEGEHLTTGWEPDVPATDTLVRQAALLHASWGSAVAAALGRAHHRTGTWAAANVGDRGALTNPVVVLRPVTSSELRDVLAEVDEVVPAPAPYVLLSPFPVLDVPSELALIGHPPLMVRPPGGEPPPLPAGVELLEVEDADRLAVAERVLIEGYPMPELQPVRTGSILAPPVLEGPTRVWLAEVDGEPAAVAAAHAGEGGGVLVEYVAALPRARGRGAGAAVTWAATLSGRDQPAFLVASDDGRPVYERMGFLAVERWTAFVSRR